MALLLRSWNVFHGNAVPPRRDSYLEQAVRLASTDHPDLLFLQEVPVWALDRLAAWSGMTAVGDVAAPPRLGPFPSTASIGHAITALHYGRFRSAFTGQANALLVSSRTRVLARHTLALNDAGFRRAQARWLALPLLTRLAWAKERRVCQAVRLRLDDGRVMLAANMHCTSYADQRLPDAELLRAAVFADALADPSDVCVLAGDFNVRSARSRTLAELTGSDWGFSSPGPWIDHILVRGATVGPVETWPRERRLVEGRLLSDHAPVEVTLE